MARRVRRNSHRAAGTGRETLVGPILLLLPIPCLCVGGGLTDGLDATSGPSALVFALAALQIRRDAPVHDTGADQKTVPESGGCLRGGDHGRKYGQSEVETSISARCAWERKGGGRQIGPTRATPWPRLHYRGEGAAVQPGGAERVCPVKGVLAADRLPQGRHGELKDMIGRVVMQPMQRASASNCRRPSGTGTGGGPTSKRRTRPPGRVNPPKSLTAQVRRTGSASSTSCSCGNVPGRLNAYPLKAMGRTVASAWRER